MRKTRRQRETETDFDRVVTQLQGVTGDGQAFGRIAENRFQAQFAPNASLRALSNEETNCLEIFDYPFHFLRGFLSTVNQYPLKRGCTCVRKREKERTDIIRFFDCIKHVWFVKESNDWPQKESWRTTNDLNAWCNCGKIRKRLIPFDWSRMKNTRLRIKLILQLLSYAGLAAPRLKCQDCDDRNQI